MEELIEVVGKGNAEKIVEACEWARGHEGVEQILENA